MRRTSLKRKTPLARKSRLKPGDRFRVGRREFTLPASASTYGADPFVRAAEDDVLQRGDITIAEATPILKRREREPKRILEHRSRSRSRSKYATRTRDSSYMLFVKTLPCAVKTYSMPWRFDELHHDTTCGGPIEADHMGRRPVGRKAPDDTCGPLCRDHHVERTAHSGMFRHATRAELRQWMDAIVADTRDLYARRTGHA